MLNQQIEFTLDHNHQTFQKLSNPHSHDSLEVMLCLSNGGMFCVNDRLLPLYYGTLVVIQNKVDHYCVVDVSKFNRYSLRIPNHTLETISSLQSDFKSIFENSVFSVNLTEEQTTTLKHLMDQCLTCGIEFGGDFRRIIFFFQILLALAKILRQVPQGREATISRDYQKILPIIQYIHNHYSEEVSVQQLSSLCYLSKGYLSHLFHDVTGFSIKGYLINYRIRQACGLLSRGHSVQDSGSAVGFSNSAYFIQSFKRIVGITPGKYANEYRQ